MSSIRPHTCAAPGPRGTHCTMHPGHDYSCYDAGEDESFNSRQEFVHDCWDETCTTPNFLNEGD